MEGDTPPDPALLHVGIIILIHVMYNKLSPNNSNLLYSYIVSFASQLWKTILKLIHKKSRFIAQLCTLSLPFCHFQNLNQMAVPRMNFPDIYVNKIEENISIGIFLKLYMHVKDFLAHFRYLNMVLWEHRFEVIIVLMQIQ